MASAIGRMAALAKTGNIIIAEREDRVVGAVVYIPAGRPKAAYFDQSWPIIRMLVVDPPYRGIGIGVRSNGRMHQPRAARRIASDCPPYELDHECRAADVYSDGISICQERTRHLWRALCRLPQRTN
jgi:hypothetical protein